MPKDDLTAALAAAPANLPAAQAAADWWASRFLPETPPRFLPETPPRFDNGDPTPEGGITMMYAILNHQNTPNPTKESVEAFRALLAMVVTGLLEMEQDKTVTLDVDYGPCPLLGGCVREAGLWKFCSALPWKTIMHVTSESVELRLGYGASSETIFPESSRAGDAS